MSSIRYLNTVLTILAVLLGLQLWTSWTHSPEMISPAAAQGIPDEGAQRQQMIDQLKLLNKNSDQIQKMLVSGKVKVLVVGEAKPDDESR